MNGSAAGELGFFHEQFACTRHSADSRLTVPLSPQLSPITFSTCPRSASALVPVAEEKRRLHGLITPSWVLPRLTPLSRSSVCIFAIKTRKNEKLRPAQPLAPRLHGCPPLAHIPLKPFLRVELMQRLIKLRRGEGASPPQNKTRCEGGWRPSSSTGLGILSLSLKQNPRIWMNVRARIEASRATRKGAEKTR